jgi:small subunit ribosomal protein S16
MVILRFARNGRIHLSHFALVAACQSKARDGRFLEKLGYYDPQKKGQKFTFFIDRIEYWLSKGAQMSDKVKLFYNEIKENKAVPSYKKKVSTSSEEYFSINDENVSIEQSQDTL